MVEKLGKIVFEYIIHSLSTDGAVSLNSKNINIDAKV